MPSVHVTRGRRGIAFASPERGESGSKSDGRREDEGDRELEL
jgi:hypothetical protein